MHKKTLILALSSLTLAALSQAQWTPLASDDFESYTFGQQPGGDWYKLGNNSSSGANELITDQTGGTASDSGIVLPPNTAGSGKGLYFYDNSNSSTSRAGLNFGDASQNYDVGYVSFNFSFVTVDTESTGSFGVIVLTSADNTTFGSPSNQTLAINLKYNGSLTWSGGSKTLTDPTDAHSMEIVANGGDSAFTYTALDGSGETSVASKTFDLYIDDTLVGASIGFTTPSLELGRFGVNTFSTATGADFLIDNLETYTSVPEPSESAALLAALALLLSLAVRRRTHA